MPLPSWILGRFDADSIELVIVEKRNARREARSGFSGQQPGSVGFLWLDKCGEECPCPVPGAKVETADAQTRLCTTSLLREDWESSLRLGAIALLFLDVACNEDLKLS